MNYEELYKKAQKDLENVRVQKAQIQEKINLLVEKLDLNPELSLIDQANSLKVELEAKKQSLIQELDRLSEELKKYE